MELNDYQKLAMRTAEELADYIRWHYNMESTELAELLALAKKGEK